MSYDRVRPPGEWANPSFATLTPAELEALDARYQALDGESGGAYTPTNPIVVGGEGIMNANAAELDCGTSEITTKTFNGITANRVNVINASKVSRRITLNLTMSPSDGTHFKAYITVLQEGAEVVINWGVTEVWRYEAVRRMTRIELIIERRAGVWKIVHASSDGNDLPDANVLALAAIPDSEDSPSYYEVARDEFVIEDTISDQRRFWLNQNRAVGKSHSFLFKNLADGADIQFRSPASNILHRYRVSGSGERDVYFRWTMVSTGVTSKEWMLIEQTKRIRQARTLVSSKVNGTISVDVEEYSSLFIEATMVAGNHLIVDLQGDVSEGARFSVYIAGVNPESDNQCSVLFRDNGTERKQFNFGGEDVQPVRFPSKLNVPRAGTQISASEFVLLPPYAQYRGFSSLYFYAEHINGRWLFGLYN